MRRRPFRPRTFTRPCALVVALMRLTLVVCVAVGGATPLRAQDSAQPAAGSDSSVSHTDPASPRAALAGWLAAERADDHASAARWLEAGDASPARRAELARMLGAVLARHVLIDLDAVSGEAEGDPEDAGGTRREFVGTIPVDGGRDTVWLVRASTRRDSTAWRFPPSVTSRIERWHARLPNPWIRARLPAPLLADGPYGVQWWQWLAIALVPVVAALVGWLLARPAGILARRVVSRTAASWDDRIIDRLAGPVRLGIASTVATPLLRALGLPLGVEGTLVAIARAAGLLALFWALLRGTRLLERTLEGGSWGATPQGRSLIPLLGRILRVVLGAIALLVALSQLGYSVGTLLAGLGLGGIAVALAAQKTIENLFGSLSIAADRAFRVGDWVSVDGTSGAVERIGLRSTSIRTLGRSVVRIPNGKLAEMKIENFGVRDRFVLDVTLTLDAATTTAQLARILDAWRATLTAHPGRWAEPGTTVRLVGFADGAPQVLVQGWFDTPDVNRFREWQEEVLTALHDAVAREGSRLAAPVRRVELAGERRASSGVGG